MPNFNFRRRIALCATHGGAKGRILCARFSTALLAPHPCLEHLLSGNSEVRESRSTALLAPHPCLEHLLSRNSEVRESCSTALLAPHPCLEHLLSGSLDFRGRSIPTRLAMNTGMTLYFFRFFLFLILLQWVKAGAVVITTFSRFVSGPPPYVFF